MFSPPRGPPAGQGGGGVVVGGPDWPGGSTVPFTSSLPAQHQAAGLLPPTAPWGVNPDVNPGGAFNMNDVVANAAAELAEARDGPPSAVDPPDDQAEVVAEPLVDDAMDLDGAE